MSLPEPDEDDLCPHCEHPFDPHALLMPAEADEDGRPKQSTMTMSGVILCPEPGCRCISTWSIDGEPRPPIQMVAALLERVREVRGEPEGWPQEMVARLYRSWSD